MILFQEYDFEIIVKPGRLNLGPDHLSRIDSGEEPTNLDEGFPPPEMTTQQKKQLVVRAADFTLIAEQLYKMGPDEILRRCVLEHEKPLILAEEHSGAAGGHYAGKATA